MIVVTSSVLILILGFSPIIFVLGEYNIKNVVPTYLYRKFKNVTEDVFSNDIRLKVSLSRLEGTLLYSIDRHMNQLIVSLSDVMEPTLGIEFRNEGYSLSLRELCGCKRCRYEELDLSIWIEDKIYVKCNGGSLYKYTYSKVKGLNEAYPILYSQYDSTQGMENEAHLWLVNTPGDNGLYPNGEQLYGCIFNVWYKNEPLKFTNKIGNIEDKCKMTCVNNVCNGGECYETYNERPVCNCTKTFLSGDFCNDTLSTINFRSSNKHLSFHMIKVSWISSSKEILILKNSNIQILLHVEDSKLFFEYIYLAMFKTSIKSIISQSYTPDREYIFIASFYETFIFIQFYNNGSWSSQNIPSNTDLRDEIFTSLTLRSGDGKMALFSKGYSKQYKLMKFSTEKGKEIKDTKMVSNIKSTENFKIVSITGFREHKKELVEVNVSTRNYYTSLIPYTFGVVLAILILNVAVIIFIGLKSYIIKKRPKGDYENKSIIS